MFEEIFSFHKFKFAICVLISVVADTQNITKVLMRTNKVIVSVHQDFVGNPNPCEYVSNRLAWPVGTYSVSKYNS